MAEPLSGTTGSPRGERLRPLAIVADDVVENRTVLAALVRREGFDAIEAADGEEVVRLTLEHDPDLLFLDVVMPRLDGLDALERIRIERPAVAVVVVTASEDPDHSRRALELGALNYVRRPFDAEEIGFVVGRIRAALDEEGEIRAAVRLVTERRTALELDNDLTLIPSIVSLLGRELTRTYRRQVLPVTEIKLALYEAIANAIEHGNLEIGYAEKTQAMERASLASMVDLRRVQSPYRERRVRVTARYTQERVEYTIADEGMGFRIEDAERARAEAPVTALHGRGLLLIRHYVDEVSWNERGNEIRLATNLPGAEGSGSWPVNG